MVGRAACRSGWRLYKLVRLYCAAESALYQVATGVAYTHCLHNYIVASVHHLLNLPDISWGIPQCVHVSSNVR